MPEIMLLCGTCDRSPEGDFEVVTEIRRTSFHSHTDTDKGESSNTCMRKDVTVAVIRIQPCKKCLKKEYDRGFEDGEESMDDRWQANVNEGRV